jgi:hypothetical protein
MGRIHIDGVFRVRVCRRRRSDKNKRDEQRANDGTHDYLLKTTHENRPDGSLWTVLASGPLANLLENFVGEAGSVLLVIRISGSRGNGAEESESCDSGTEERAHEEVSYLLGAGFLPCLNLN